VRERENRETVVLPRILVKIWVGVKSGVCRAALSTNGLFVPPPHRACDGFGEAGTIAGVAEEAALCLCLCGDRPRRELHRRFNPQRSL
jgi:hypothetical protein